jgi:hypothetical protein
MNHRAGHPHTLPLLCYLTVHCTPESAVAYRIQVTRCCACFVFAKPAFAGLSPWFAHVRRGGGGGLHFGLVRRALFIFAPRSTPNKLLLTAVTRFSQGRVAAWPLAVAAEECQHAIPHCLGSRAAFQASLSPISTQGI